MICEQILFLFLVRKNKEIRQKEKLIQLNQTNRRSFFLIFLRWS